MKSEVGLLIGAGSIGKRHALVMRTHYQQIVIVDTNDQIRNWVETNMGTDTPFFTSLNEALGFIRNQASSVSAVVANLAPDHFDTLHSLMKAGIKRIVCEKPITNCLDDANKLVELTKIYGARIIVNIPRRFTKFAEAINEFSNQRMGGPPTSMVVHGGAKCLVTNGSHWVDFAISLFGEPPEKVVSFAEPEFINPRGKNLEMWGGVSTWWFSGGRTLTISFDNASSVESVANIYSRNGRTDCFIDGSADFFLRKPEELLIDSRTTRSGLVYRLHDRIEPIDGNTFLLALLAIETSESPDFTLGEALMSNEATLGALVSAREKQIVTFPITKDFECFTNRWNVT